MTIIAQARIAIIITAAITGIAASAQMPSLPGGLSGGLSGLTGALPNVAGATAGNAAGVISYCVKNNYLSGNNATSVLGKLTGMKGVAGSKDYAQGSDGQLQTGKGSPLSLSGLKGKATTKLCSMVLDHGKSLAGL